MSDENADPTSRLIVQLPPFPGGRIESGPLKFGDDWPGIFLRGDSALFFAKALRRTIGRMSSTDVDWADKAMLIGLADTLESCSVGDTGWPP
jgi:hypothetical protein